MDDELCPHCRNYRRIDAFDGDQFAEHINRCERFALRDMIAEVLDNPGLYFTGYGIECADWIERAKKLLRRNDASH